MCQAYTLNNVGVIWHKVKCLEDTVVLNVVADGDFVIDHCVQISSKNTNWLCYRLSNVACIFRSSHIFVFLPYRI